MARLNSNIRRGISSKSMIFFQGLKARGNVEEWLGKVEDSMVACLRKLTKGSIAEYEMKKREEWVTQHPSQVRPEYFVMSQFFEYIVLSTRSLVCQGNFLLFYPIVLLLSSVTFSWLIT